MLEAHDLAGRRGHAELFVGVGFRLAPGQAIVVTGPNGTGKTTLLRMLAGLSAPAAGEIRLNGRKVAPFAPELRSTVAYSGHLPSLKDELSAEENLASLVHLAGGVANREEVRAVLDTVALGRRRTLPARVLSAGQRRRIGLARLALLKRPVWVLDEPVTALDAAGIEYLAGLVHDHLDGGGVAVVATHQALGLAPERVQSLVLGAAKAASAEAHC